MFERLLDAWLDSAGERTYQGPFCQALAAQGYTVLHSTRHAPIEFGKDVIALMPDGTPCAYQLKGNPGSRLTLTQFREIQPQLFQLATQAIVLPGVPPGRHRCYLVTNGQIDEEVHRSIDDMNRSLQPTGLTPVEVIARGQLLAMFQEQAKNFWPSEIPDLHRIFQLLALHGEEQPPYELLHHVLTQMFRLGTEDERLKKEELRRRITSAAVVLAVCLRSFSQKENHFVVIAGWALFSTYTIAACARHGHDFDELGAASVEVALETVLFRLTDLAKEAVERTHHFQGDMFIDAAVVGGRQTLLVGLFSVLWLWRNRRDSWPSPEAKVLVEDAVKKCRPRMELWGEAAVPQYLAYYWYLRSTDATMAPDGFLLGLLRALVTQRREGEDQFTLPSPYYSFEDVRRHYLARVTGRPDPMDGDSRKAASYFAEAIFHLAARTGLKVSCKDIWPDLTRVMHCSFIPEHPWQYCVWRSEDGQNKDRLLPLGETWDGLVEQARFVGTPEIPDALRKLPELLLLFVLLAPFRGTPNVVRFLGWTFSEPWFIQPPVEESR